MQATDAYTGAGIPGVTVTCKDGGANGKFSSLTGVTDSSGNVSTNYTFWLKAKPVTITCSATGYISAVFGETAVAGPANSISPFSGNAQTAPVNTQLPAPLVAKVVDAHTNPIQGASVTFSDSGKGGTFSPSTVITDALGHATTSYTTPETAGTVRITITSGSLKPNYFKVIVTAAP
jgi:hypothetical protein